MQPKTYAITLIAAAAALFLTVVGANVIIDAQGVFGNRFVPRAENVNHHYQQLIAYQAAPHQYDGIVLGSSRAYAIPRDELSRRMNGARFANFAVAGGMLQDNLPALEFVLRDKTRRGERLRAVFLLLDIDAFGTPAVTNQTIQTLLPPAMSGKSAWSFWWTNLVSIQPDSWRNALREARRGPQLPSDRARPLPNDRVDQLLWKASAAIARKPPQRSAARLSPGELERVSARNGFVDQLRLLQRLVTLCREHDVALVVATSPLHATVTRDLDPADLSNAIDRIAQIVPVWDFTETAWLSADPKYWNGDASHFSTEVAEKMLERIFGDEMAGIWKDFGRRRAP